MKIVQFFFLVTNNEDTIDEGYVATKLALQSLTKRKKKTHSALRDDLM